MAETNPYSSKVEITDPEVAQTAAETADAGRDAFERKMTDKTFFAYMQKKSGGELSTFLADETDSALNTEAETYDRDVAPTLEKFKNFLGGEFASKLRLIPSAGKREVMGKIDDYLLDKAVGDPTQFAAYGAKIDKFMETSDHADKLEQDLLKYGDTVGEQKAVAKAMEQGVANADSLYAKNKDTFDNRVDKASRDATDAHNAAGKGPINALRKFGNRLLRKGSLTGEQIKIGSQFKENFDNEKAVLDRNQDNITKQQEELRKQAAEISSGHAQIEALNTAIGTSRAEILEYFGEAQEVRKLLLEQIRLAVDAGKYNAEAGADTMQAYQSMWEDESGADEGEVSEIMQTIYKKEIEKSADHAKDSVRPDKLQDFTNFLLNYTDASSREIVKLALEESITAEADKSSPRAAQLAMMKRRLGSIK